jgi:hypothetical protein
MHEPVDNERGCRGPVYGDGGYGSPLNGWDITQEVEERVSPRPCPVCIVVAHLPRNSNPQERIRKV